MAGARAIAVATRSHSCALPEERAVFAPPSLRVGPVAEERTSSSTSFNALTLLPPTI